jgi:hypothetical protein
MNEKKSKTVVKTDLLLAEEVADYIKKLEDLKTWIIYAATGQVELNDESALTHLKDLNYLQSNLDHLRENLEMKLITFDNEKAWGKFD